MRLIVDVYNVLHVVGEHGALAASLTPEGLAALVDGSRYGGRGALLVCDGTPAGGGARTRRVGSAEVVYAGAGRDADSLIEALIERDTGPRRLVVVSGDRRIQRAARRRRARVLESEVFLGHLAADRARGAGEGVARGPVDPDEVEGWIEMLGASGVDVEASGDGGGGAAPPATPEEWADDPEVREAWRRFGGGIDPEDLDMDRWMEGGGDR